MSETGVNWNVGSMVLRAIPLLVILSLLELGSGFVLESLRESFLSYHSLLVLVPSVIGLAGNMGSVLSSKISTGLHLGTIDFSDSVFDEKVVSESLGVVMIALSLSLVMGVFSYIFGTLSGNPLPFIKVVSVSVVSSFLLSIFVIFLSVLVVYTAYRRGADPDDVAIPVVTNLSDIVGILVFAGTVLLIV